MLLVTCFLLAIWGTIIRVNEGVTETKDELKKNGQLMVQDLDHELDIHVHDLLAMKYISERYFNGRIHGAENPVTHLQTLAQSDSYHSVLPDSLGSSNVVGRFTGYGKLPTLDDPIAQEMEMAVGLIPVMRAIRDRSKDVPWVQYASARGFMFIYPLRGAEQFHFTPDLVRRDYLALATPEANPQREIFWSAPYDDAAGKGRIITATQPIYEKDEFRGSVSIDILVTSLRRMLSTSNIAKAHVHLVDSNGAIIIAASVDPDDSFKKEHQVVKLKLKNAPWTVELYMDQEDLFLHSLKERTWHIITLFVLAICLIAVILLTYKSRQIHEMSIRDGLTNLYNRRYFDEIANQQFELAKRHHLPIALAIIDIDFFKKFNDHYGHQEGDRALCAVANAVLSVLKRNTDQFFRVGGEEFAILATISNEQDLRVMMEKINQVVRDLRLPHIGNPSGFVTISIGATLIAKDHWIDLNTAYKKTDESLYQAKSNGRDQTVVSSK